MPALAMRWQETLRAWAWPAGSVLALLLPLATAWPAAAPVPGATPPALHTADMV